jgi:predicted GNAT family N-acyltransferase
MFKLRTKTIMDDAAVKETRRLLRQVQEHLFLSHADLGVQRETMGMVELVYHPQTSVSELNYVTPRRKTAWGAAKFVEEGLQRLQALGRVPCVTYIEGLYPPLFGKTLHEFSLEAHQEISFMLYRAGGIPALGVPAFSPEPVSADEDVQVRLVEDQHAAEMWWEIWRNGLYDVVAAGMEPLVRWHDTDEQHGQQIDIFIHRQKSLAAVTRLSIQPENSSSQIVALALLQEDRSPELMQLLLHAALQESLARQCELVFGPGETEDLRRLYRELGFIDIGSLVTYIQKSGISGEGNRDGGVVQPVPAAPQ